MGYTHYWTQRRNFNKTEWKTISDDLRGILNHAQHEMGIALANGMGDGGTVPEFTADHIAFNGVGDDAHETFLIPRVRVLESWQEKKHLGWAFCKTARKPYDSVVTACLCYLGSITRKDSDAGEPIIGSEAITTTSDGDGSDFLEGLELARKSLPRVANQLDLPLAVMQSDRWCAPWVNCKLTDYEVHFCVDGKGYVLHGKDSYCFESHMALAQYLERTKFARFKNGGHTSWGGYPAHEENIWNAMGSFDAARHARIAKAQKTVLAKLFPVDSSCAHQPPLFVRPGEMPDNAGRDFCYSVADLLNLAKAA